MSANMANLAIHPLGVDKWVVSWTQAFAMRICIVAPPGECLRVKADMVLSAGNTVWSISERVRGVREEALYKSTFTYLLTLIYISAVNQNTDVQVLVTVSQCCQCWHLCRRAASACRCHKCRRDSAACRATESELTSDRSLRTVTRH